MSVTASSSTALTTADQLEEFFITTCWVYTPKAVKRVIDDLMSLQLPSCEVMFDPEHHWFKVMCQKMDAMAIRKRFNMVTAQIEEEALDGGLGQLLSPNGKVKDSFENEWIIGTGEFISLKRIKATDYDGYRYPSAIAKFPYRDVWDELEKQDGVLILSDILADDQRLQLERDTKAAITYDIAGTSIYIGGYDDAGVSQARSKLRVLLSAKNIEIFSARFEHLLYAEDYGEEHVGFTADLRYMTNIDRSLTSSTLIDGAKVSSLEKAYARMYKVGVSIRLCEWDEGKHHHVSMFGPRVQGRGHNKGKQVLGNRPLTSNKTKEDCYDQPEQPYSVAKSGIDAWIANIPDTGSADSASVGFSAGHSFDTEQDSLECDSCLSSNAAAWDRLIDVNCPPAVLPMQDRLIDIGPPSTCTGDLLADKGNELEELKKLKTLKLGDSKESEDVDEGHGIKPSTGFMGLLDLEDQNSVAVDLINPDDPKSSSHLDTATFERYDDPSAKRFQTMNQQGENRKLPVMDLLDIDEAKTIRKPPNGFAGDIETSIQRLLFSSPFRAGFLEVRAEFGRAILGEMDQTGLAFNCAKIPSNGWEKMDLLTKLNAVTLLDPVQQRDRIHFTKILSTSGADAEDLINMKSAGKPLWTAKPAASWTVYSFRCVLDTGGTPDQFLVEIEDHGPNSSSPKHMSTMIKPVHPAHDADGSTPLYVHAIRRRWDLRFMLMHVNHKDMEWEFGSFARQLLRGLEISWKDGPDLKFSVPTGMVNVKNVRVLTKWRHLSPDSKSALEITEVEQLALEQLSRHTSAPQGMLQKEDFHAHPRDAQTSRDMELNGDPSRWYEAAVISATLEDVFKANTLISVGEKANWEVENLKEMGAFPSLYQPALEMVKQMDHIGRNNDNGYGERLWDTVARKNYPDPSVVGMDAYNMRKQDGSSSKNLGVNLSTQKPADGPQQKWF